MDQEKARSTKMLRKSIKALPIALVASAALVLSGCANPKADNGTPADQQAQAGVFEFQTPRYGAEGELAIRIPDALIEAAGNDADGLLVSEVKAKARELDSSKYCAVDLAISYRGDGLDALAKPKETEAEHDRRAENEREYILDREFGVSTIEEVKELKLKEGWSPEEVDELVAEFAAAGDIGPYEAKSAWEPLNTAASIDDLDPSDPETGSYSSDDFKTLTWVLECAASPAADDRTKSFGFPVSTDSGEIDNFAHVEISVMKSGTLTITEADVSDYESDSNGDWIGG